MKIREINREDMLELTRRMTVSRNCFSRVAGAYFDADGFVDGTFNIHFKKLSNSDQSKNLKLAKTIPFSKTNEELKEYIFPDSAMGPGSIWQLFMGLRACELKNDALLDTFYDLVGERYIGQEQRDMGLFVFYGCYDIRRKGLDQNDEGDSEESYPFLLGLLSPVHGDYEMGDPEWGFLFPAFSERSAVIGAIDIFDIQPNPKKEALYHMILGERH